MPRQTLYKIADAINAEFPELEASVEKSWCNTDRHPKGVCWRIPGKGRPGLKLTVKARQAFTLSGPLYFLSDLEYAPGDIVFRHDSAQTYRRNSEVIDRLDRFRKLRQS